ncbi:glycoside hydrolase superfamily, partial [Dendryphion nanum]
MRYSTISSAFMALGLYASTASAVFDAKSNSNVAVYWGQGRDQIGLSEVCEDPSIDIVNVGFVNYFPKKVGDYPGTNFANACSGTNYNNTDGTESKLLNSCPGIGPGIKKCQANGKKVLLSIGGGYPHDYYLPSVEVAKYFAEFLWGAFGPQTAKWVRDGKPRPFGDAVFDGFDLDIEASEEPNPPFADYKWANYAAFVTHLKKELFPKALGQYYISGAPQCVIPDARLADAIQNSLFDFIFVQFYNTPQCSVRAGLNEIQGKPPNVNGAKFTFNDWVTWLNTYSLNKEVKIYIGLVGDTHGVEKDKESYLTPAEANTLIGYYFRRNRAIFGGVMLWEATVSKRNQLCNKNYG